MIAKLPHRSGSVSHRQTEAPDIQREIEYTFQGKYNGRTERALGAVALDRRNYLLVGFVRVESGQLFCQHSRRYSYQFAA